MRLNFAALDSSTFTLLKSRSDGVSETDVRTAAISTILTPERNLTPHTNLYTFFPVINCS